MLNSWHAQLLFWHAQAEVADKGIALAVNDGAQSDNDDISSPRAAAEVCGGLVALCPVSSLKL